jgi:hypothetical protein
MPSTATNLSLSALGTSLLDAPEGIQRPNDFESTRTDLWRMHTQLLGLCKVCEQFLSFFGRSFCCPYEPRYPVSEMRNWFEERRYDVPYFRLKLQKQRR